MWTSVLFLALLVFGQLLIAFDPSVSNGTCFFGAAKPADDIYIPCGNDAGGHKTCCQARDVCLSSLACYNAKWGVTYFAGCTDPDYLNSVCPWKGQYLAQQWVGLVRCFHSNDTERQDEDWAGCEDKDQPQVSKPDPCTCRPDDLIPMFKDAPALTNVASLPVSAGNLIAWYDGFTPSTTSTLSTNIATRTGSETSNVGNSNVQSSTLVQSITPTSTSDQTRNYTNSSRDSSLPTSAKVGIGIGAAAGFVIVVTVIWVLKRIFHSRKSPPASIMGNTRPRSQIDPEFHNQVTPTTLDPDLRSPAWSGHKSELPADEPHTRSVIGYAKSQRSSRQPSELQTPTYQAYNPYRSHMPEGMVTEKVVSPTSNDENKSVYELPG